MIRPHQVALGRAAPFGRREVESGKFDRRGHHEFCMGSLCFWRDAGAAPYKGLDPVRKRAVQQAQA